MNDLSSIVIPKLSDNKKFEYLCRDLWINDPNNELVSLNSRRGQPQNGVDIFGRKEKSGEWFGIQCKVRSNKLTRDEILDEIKKVENFNPSLKEYVICTTLDRDEKLQQIMREVNDELKQKNKFTFHLLFWNDIEERLKDESNLKIYYKFYHNYFADNATIGQSIGKLINLELGRENNLDTHYELLFGKIPNYKDNDHYNANYYRGTYFVINFHECKAESFTLPTFEGDLENAFSNRYDRFRISKWINSITDFDSFLYNDDPSYETFISIEEEKKYLDSIIDDT